MEIRYNRQVQSVAMSKWPNQVGLSLTKVGDVIDVESINPRTNSTTTYLRMQIPVEAIDEVINVLNQLK